MIFQDKFYEISKHNHFRIIFKLLKKLAKSLHLSARLEIYSITIRLSIFISSPNTVLVTSLSLTVSFSVSTFFLWKFKITFSNLYISAVYKLNSGKIHLQSQNKAINTGLNSKVIYLTRFGDEQIQMWYKILR